MPNTNITIHPRAIVHPHAKIGEGTTIGADAIVDEFVQIGDRCEIRARAIITGHTQIGHDNQIGYGAIIGSEPQDISYQGEVSFVEIGDRNILREYVTVNRGTKEGSKTRIGNDNLLLTGAHVAHNCQVSDRVVLVNNVLLAGYVEVANNAFMGGDSVVHQFTRIGAYAMVRGQTRLSVDVPPYCMAVDTNMLLGLNRLGLRRNGFSPERRRAILNAYKVVYLSNRNRSQALEFLSTTPEFSNNPDIQLFCEFIKSSRRGICKHYERGTSCIEDD
ncbi:MAG: acyl-ACP--UDP-N-acetylglucosamine O-acyltransferase [Pseudanabaena sp.]|jgi:UDP-N-acetylglucosamine acyltransferase|uniref:acyl-ACP--UDP-N-acetylglucosamine O-acyltransferase n=1 Tax=Pseudanabaena mucicola TaxID=71190 RepID=UPI002579000F|nr:acyl-ACP--UDP-N-acetylglucosamine O-acyltransferase [Pseudanabaena mucicola]MCA6574596.1 acyl-ACP--UDP-N-acetylglucosamine O-acyltransferase [Pseudanabaena sp. M53BS1SP1A06MG]MCA6580720.1 acyl-ACP--UDP-N-acetylglucosamine O-acyltransferase [Pseudanabaena sp. M34BS1SP1A06MG]MCA6584948.1 acyl-ACP--UDP-N-acetylglucosamine O-acyltransferase [Pseudanabaena sp. M051S1SP1A06QC]MCA6589323.1 acyl-ACP--UDP-N-acetylglucosamine O-acyltransferase [Pseudanabaena sp. M109S1SP1A06QC]MCA6590665.1 acyl-ACP--